MFSETPGTLKIPSAGAKVQIKKRTKTKKKKARLDRGIRKARDERGVAKEAKGKKEEISRSYHGRIKRREG
jgi:hypothetical protein